MELIPRHEKWRREYRLRRYLEHATKEQLSQRVRDIVCNFTLLHENGKMSFRAPDEGGAFWHEKFTHTAEEHSLRGEGFQPNLMESALLPRPTFPARPRSAEAFVGHQLSPGAFVKYGKRKYLESGSIRISPASSWVRSENPAIFDNELRKTFFTHPDEVEIRVHKSRNLPKGHRIEPVGSVDYTHTARKDYYALCLSSVYDHRLFDDFEADCCLIVDNPKLFAERVGTAVGRALGHASVMMGRAIVYYDPFNSTQGEVDVHWSKDFRFWYQHEFRLVWHFAGGETELQPIDLHVGPICDFGQLICLA